MGNQSGIVAGGGWQEVYVYGRHKARAFGSAAAGWSVVTVMACFILWIVSTIPEEAGLALRLVPWLMMAPHPVFIVLAVYYWFTEKPTVREYLEDIN